LTKKIKLNQEEVELKSENLEFNETELNDFLKKAASNLAYYNERYAVAQYISAMYEDKAEELYEIRFKEAKENGGSDKLANAFATASDDVKEAKTKARLAKYHVNLLYGYIKALDRANTNAINLGYNIRKEIDKLGVSVKSFENMSKEQLVDELTKYE
jgi:hypothetical protein